MSKTPTQRMSVIKTKIKSFIHAYAIKALKKCCKWTVQNFKRKNHLSVIFGSGLFKKAMKAVIEN